MRKQKCIKVIEPPVWNVPENIRLQFLGVQLPLPSKSDLALYPPPWDKKDTHFFVLRRRAIIALSDHEKQGAVNYLMKEKERYLLLEKRICEVVPVE